MGLSGADLEYQRMLAEASVNPLNSAGYDGPLLEQLADQQDIYDNPVESISPDDFSGATDGAKLQACINYCIANDYPTIKMDRMLVLTGHAPISVDKAVWSNRQSITFEGTGGGIIKHDAGAVFTSATENTGDLTFRGVKYISTSGAGSILIDGDKLIRIFSSGCEYRNWDLILSQTTVGRWTQSMRFHREKIVGGTGPAFKWRESYDVTLDDILCEDRSGTVAFVSNSDGTMTGIANRNLRITKNIIENCAGVPIKLAMNWSVLIQANYFEQNGAATDPQIDLYSLATLSAQASVILSNNQVQQTVAQKAAKIGAILHGPGRALDVVTSEGNISDGGIMHQFGAASGLIFGNGDYVESSGLVIYPGQENRYFTPGGKETTTATRPKNPRINKDIYFDTTIKKLIVPTVLGTKGIVSLRFTAGATNSGNITITIFGVAHVVSVTAGDTLTQVRDKVIAAYASFFPTWRLAASSTNIVTFNAFQPGPISGALSFNAAATGVTSDYFAIDNVGSDPTWSEVGLYQLNVKDYGAIGNGITDDSAAFNNALTAANSMTGKVNIIVPAGTYNLTAGLTTVITNNYVTIVGEGIGVTTLTVTNGTLFQWGNNVGTILGGGIRDCSITATSPHSAQKVILINGGSSQRFSNILLDNVRQLASLGVVGAGTSSGAQFSDIIGNTDPASGSVVIDAVNGFSLSLDHVILNAKGVGFPSDGTTLHPAADTTFLRFGQGSWDTAHCTEVITNRYNRGLDINVESAVNVGNMWFNSCVFDYSKTSGVRLRTNHAGGGIRSIFFVSGWAVASDAHSVEVACSLGTMKNISFSQFVGRQAGKNNWRFSGGGSIDGVTLTDCRGIGANRLSSTNVGTDLDDVAILTSGVTILGGRFGEDGQSYTSITPNQGRYGITVSADLNVYSVMNALVDGATDPFQLPATNSAGSYRRRVNGNRSVVDTAVVNYATTTAVVAPASTATQTHTGATVDTLYIYGGTVTSIVHNGTEIGTTGPATLVLNPGDTWQITYSVAPTIKRIVSP